MCSGPRPGPQASADRDFGGGKAVDLDPADLARGQRTDTGGRAGIDQVAGAERDQARQMGDDVRHRPDHVGQIGILADIARDKGADAALAERVRTLISRHEEGGTDEQNLLRDADSVSFFENNCDYFLRVLAAKEGPATVRAKFAWMFERIGSEPARRIARPWYEAALARLNGLETNR